MNGERFTEHYQATCPGCAHRWMLRRVAEGMPVRIDEETTCPVCAAAVHVIRLASYRSGDQDDGPPEPTT